LFQTRPLRAVRFNLDGTLLDTANDIALALHAAGLTLGVVTRWSPISSSALLVRGWPCAALRHGSSCRDCLVSGEGVQCTAVAWKFGK
jgi:hypothetical protein